MTVLPELERQLVRAAAAAGTVGQGSGARRARAGWLAVAVAGAVAVGVLVVFLAVGTHQPNVRAGSHAPAIHKSVGPPSSRPVPFGALMRPLHVPTLRPGERCPVSSGTRLTTPELGVVDTLGTGPVRPDIGDSVDLAHGRIVLGIPGQPGWFAIEVVWFSVPSYHGPWLVRAVRLRGLGRAELGGQPLGPRRGGPRVSISDLKVSSGPTSPGTTWISAPGCYAWQVDGVGFSKVIVFQAVAPHGGR